MRAICGFVLYRVAGDLSGLTAPRQAVDANPNNVMILSPGGIGNRRNGAIDDAYRCYARAYELSPWVAGGVSLPPRYRGVRDDPRQLEAAIDWCLKSLAAFSDWTFNYVALATCDANHGRMDEAATMVSRIRELIPNPDG